MSEGFDVEANLILFVERAVVGSVEGNTDLLVEYAFLRVHLIRF